MPRNVIPAKPADFGKVIYIYRQRFTSQVVYSFRQKLHERVLKQLTFMGKKSVPGELRLDMWAPLCTVTFPTSRQGHDAFRRLREYRMQHDYNWRNFHGKLRSDLEERGLEDVLQDEGTEADAMTKEQRTWTLMNDPHIIKKWKKERMHKLMDQKANSIADLADILTKQGEEGLQEQQTRVEQTKSDKLERSKVVKDERERLIALSKSGDIATRIEEVRAGIVAAQAKIADSSPESKKKLGRRVAQLGARIKLLKDAEKIKALISSSSTRSSSTYQTPTSEAVDTASTDLPTPAPTPASAGADPDADAETPTTSSESPLSEAKAESQTVLDAAIDEVAAARVDRATYLNHTHYARSHYLPYTQLKDFKAPGAPGQREAFTPKFFGALDVAETGASIDIQWANILDRTYAKSWPAGVEHSAIVIRKKKTSRAPGTKAQRRKQWDADEWSENLARRGYWGQELQMEWLAYEKRRAAGETEPEMEEADADVEDKPYVPFSERLTKLMPWMDTGDSPTTTKSARK